MNQRSPRATETASLSGLSFPALPAVEWMPLDELIQSWAAFAHVTTSAAGLSATSAAFAALAAETTARHVAVEASHSQPATPVALPDVVSNDLDEARQCWLEALGHLSRMSASADDEAALLVAHLGAQTVRHSQQLLALCARLWQEQPTIAASACPRL